MTATITVDGDGIHLPRSVDESCDVLFDDQHVWSFSLDNRPASPGGGHDVPWPKLMLKWLDGHTRVRVRCQGRVLYDDEVAFTDADKRVEFRDKQGIPVMIDKWGLVQRPFTGRDPAVIGEMVEVTEQILTVLREECGIEAWMAFGTLLGAAREGRVIGHDSDIDLAYLSPSSTPSVIAGEMFAISRALRRAGMKVVNKSASFVTVLFETVDGGTGSIDVYSTFYVGSLLHETATVRAPIPRTAVEPLTTMTFEGRDLPAPADHATMLAASYGPHWRTPDPSFQHRPGPEILDRFDAWFGSTMRQRREWERFHRDSLRAKTPSPFCKDVAARIAPGTHVVDAGCGTGTDALWLAGQGFRVDAFDFARGCFVSAARKARREDLPLEFSVVNLLDLRDALTYGAQVATRQAPRALVARGLLDALPSDGAENFWRFAALVLRGRGTAYVESGVMPRAHPRGAGTGRLRALDISEVAAAAEAAGGVVVERKGLEPVRVQPDDSEAPHWRLTVEWSR